MKFVIEGRPQGKARARTFWNSRTGKMQSITPEQTRSYEDLIRWSYKAAGGTYLEKAVYGGYTGLYEVPVLSQQRSALRANTALVEA
ncbi:MAG: hypothetical protein ACLRSW_05005 [Christensenellaceae bacterium]